VPGSTPSMGKLGFDVDFYGRDMLVALEA